MSDDERIDAAGLAEMYGVTRVAIDSGFTRVEIDPLHLAEILDRLLAAERTPAWVEQLAADWERSVGMLPSECAAALRARAKEGA